MNQLVKLTIFLLVLLLRVILKLYLKLVLSRKVLFELCNVIISHFYFDTKTISFMDQEKDIRKKIWVRSFLIGSIILIKKRSKKNYPVATLHLSKFIIFYRDLNLSNTFSTFQPFSAAQGFDIKLTKFPVKKSRGITNLMIMMRLYLDLCIYHTEVDKDGWEFIS